MGLLTDIIRRNFGYRRLGYDQVGLHGRFHVVAKRNGNVISSWYGPNLIVNSGRASVISSLVGTNSPISLLRLGSGGTVPEDPYTPLEKSVTQEDLVDMGGPTIDLETYEVDPNGRSATFSFVLSKTQGNGSGTAGYSEAGLYNEAGDLVAYETFPTIVKASDRVLEIDWTIFA